MRHDEYFETLRSLWDDELVICALGTSANDWWSLTRNDQAFYMHAGMGFTSSVALGLALSLPRSRVWLLDSDGGLCMNLGGLLTMADAQPANLLHLILANRCYQTLGGDRLVNAERTDFVAIARGCGIGDCLQVTDPDGLRAAVEDWTHAPFHRVVVAEVEPKSREAGFERPPTVPYDAPELKYRFGHHVESLAGVTVFGPAGF